MLKLSLWFMGELFASDRLGIRDETVSSASSIDSPQSI